MYHIQSKYEKKEEKRIITMNFVVVINYLKLESYSIKQVYCNHMVNSKKAQITTGCICR
jgi:hypothetical protein